MAIVWIYWVILSLLVQLIIREACHAVPVCCHIYIVKFLWHIGDACQVTCGGLCRTGRPANIVCERIWMPSIYSGENNNTQYELTAECQQYAS